MDKVYDVIYECRSVNNKRVRGNELEMLEKRPDELCIIIGENFKNTKKRIYKDIETLNQDYSELEKIKKNLENKNSSKILDTKNKSLLKEEDN